MSVPLMITSEIEESLTKALYNMLISIGEDPDRSGLKNTPSKVTKMYPSFLTGYKEDIHEVVGSLIPLEEQSGLITLNHTPFISLCEHHLLPFHGKVHIAFIPEKHLIGFSKVPRIVNHFARRLQIQEHLTAQIADCLMHILNPKGSMVIIEAFHSCSIIHDNLSNMSISTTALRGIFKDSVSLQNQLHHTIKDTNP